MLKLESGSNSLLNNPAGNTVSKNRMLSTTLINAFLSRHFVEKEARLIWGHGAMTGDWRTPILGEKWDEAYYPFWRKWLVENDPKRIIGYNSNYNSIDDVEFWKRASTMFEPLLLNLCIRGGASRGNLSIFEAFPDAYIQEFAQMYRVPNRKTPQTLVHPSVVKFMRDKGYWCQQDINAMAMDYQFFDSSTANIKAFDGDRGRCTSEFSADWCVQVLRDYNWPAESQAQFLGNMMHTLDGSVWLDNRVQLEPLLHPDVDVALLAGVCGMSPKYYGYISPNESVQLLYETVQQASQYGRLKVWVPLGVAGEWVINGGHKGLNLLLELMPPARPMDLYRLALKVKNMELGRGNDEIFPLPELGD
jgi:hypothetical protein